MPFDGPKIGDHTIRAMRCTHTIVLLAFIFGCASTNDPGFTSVTTTEGTGDTGDMGDTEDNPAKNCADPDLEQAIENPTISACSGQGGGALVFDVFSGIGNGVIPDKSKASPTVLFPKHVPVEACCGAAAKPDEVASACESDCARAACNTAISALEDAVADPSSLQGDGCGEICAMNVATSIAQWILPQLESWAGYNSCLTMADLNTDPAADYTAAEFVGPQLTFQRPSDACMNLGCLSNVRLRIYCAVDSVMPTDQMCTMAANGPHPNIPESEQLIIAPSPAEITSRSNGHVEMSRATSHGGVLRQDTCDDLSCPIVLETFSLATDETIEIGSLRAWNITATLAYAAIGARVGDTVVFDTGALQFQISGVSSLANDEDIDLPLALVIANTSPARATFTGSTFSFDELEFVWAAGTDRAILAGNDGLRVSVHETSVAAVE